MKYIFSFWLIVRTCGQNIHKLAGRPNLLLHLVPPFLKTGLKLDFAIDVYIVFVDSNLTQDLEACLSLLTIRTPMGSRAPESTGRRQQSNPGACVLYMVKSHEMDSLGGCGCNSGGHIITYYKKYF